MSQTGPDPAAASAAPIFAALGDATRLSLLARLSEGHPLSITQLTLGTGLTRQGVSKHLVVLEQARIIASERVGRESRFSVQRDALVEAQLYLERASRQWDETISRLRDFVED